MVLQNQYDKSFHDITTSRYPLPIGENENKRSELLHDTMRAFWRCDFVSPIEQELKEGKNFKVLDVGCGSGTWTLQVSKDYPLANFIGIDLFPIFPKEFSQKNLQFIQGDLLKGLPFEDNTFDFVHMRMLMIAFTQIQWSEIVIKELVRVCKPGGWIEMADFDIDGKSLGPICKRMLNFVMKYLEAKGINSLISEELSDLMEDNDQIEAVYTDEIYIPIGNWGGEQGKLALESFVYSLNALTDLPKVVGISEEEFETMIEQHIEEFNHYRTYNISIRFYGQKALD